ncbi:MAG: TIGR03619 family F420-dependent LLM class oxidoreductase [Tissierellales bacterium]
MKYWLHIHNTEPEEGLKLALLAEEVGFEGVVGDDHWFMPAGSDSRDPQERGPLPAETVFPDMFVFGATILAHTKKLKYGTCVMILANRTNPFLVAKACGTLARLSDDRFVLGVGLGWMEEEYALAGVDFKTRAGRTVEMIEVLRKLWGPGPVEHHGDFFDFAATYANPRPAKPIPIYIGSAAPVALRRTGRIADGWMGMTSPLDVLPGQIALVNEGRREAQREHEPFEFMVGLPRNSDGSLPGREDYKRAEEMGVTQGHVGPIDHLLGKPFTTFDEKKRFIVDFAERVIV